MSKHTKGPWWAKIPNEKNHIPREKILLIGTDETSHNGMYGIGYLHYNMADGDSEDNQIQEANARLIAAAPDLAEILKRIIDRATAPMSNGDILYDDIDEARAALRKAGVE